MPKLIAIATLYRNAEMLPHFIAHYLKQDVDKIHIVLRGDDSCHAAAQRQLDHFDQGERKRVVIARASTGDDLHIYWLNDYESQHLQQVANDDDWILDVDLDELYDFGNSTARERVEECRHGGYGWVGGRFLDRMGLQFSLPRLPDWPNSLWGDFPLKVPFTQIVAKGCSSKVMIRKRTIDVSHGHHRIIRSTERPMPGTFHAHHFKWIRGVEALLRERMFHLENNPHPVAAMIRDELRRSVAFFDDPNRSDMDALCVKYGLPQYADLM